MAKTITRKEAFDFSDPQESDSERPSSPRPVKERPQGEPSKPSAEERRLASLEEAGTRRGAERGGELIRRTWLVPEDTARRFKVACARKGLNASDIVGSLIEDWLVRFDE